jgi:prepilin-type N-terminal cleavage/methylation domain-containing protein
MKVIYKKQSGFTLVETMIVVALVGLLAGLAVPQYAKARDNARVKAIYSNLRVLEAAKEEWALENNKGLGSMIDNVTALGSYFRQGGLREVMNEVYKPGAVGTPAEAELPGGVRLVLNQ